VHLLANRTKYDAVHTCGFPYFSLLAARAAQKLGGPPVVADWFEVWGRDYWNTYLGGIGGALGNAVERTCVRATEDAFVFSRLGAERLRAAGYDARPVVLRGMYAAGADGTQSFDMSAVRQREPLVVFVGRHIAEKRVTAIPQAVAIARERIPDLHAAIFGDGPERHRVISEIQRLGLKEIIAVPGFSPWPDVERTLSSAMCLILPSHREGYGLAVVEAAAYGTPAVVARHPDSAAVELISEGQNGFIAASSDPRDLADALVRIHSAGAKLTQTTNEWFVANEHELSIETSIATIEAVYARIVKEAR